MDKSQQSDQVNKYLTLVKQAQNEALISLIADGLKNEIQNNPLKVSQTLLDFCKKDLVSEKVSDFTRLKVSEGLVPIFNKLDISKELFDSKFSSNVQKFSERLERSHLVIKCDKSHFKMMTIGQINSSRFFSDLIEKYQPLLANSQDETTMPVQDEQSKQNTKQGIKSIVMGKFGNIQSIKLSDMIDDKFLEDVDRDDGQAPTPLEKKTPISELIEKLEQTSESIFMSNALKRQKTDTTSQPAIYVVMSPLLALALYQADQLLNLDWQKRQIAACQLRHILATTGQFTYSQVSLENSKLVLKEGGVISRDQLCQTILPRLLICMLKDNFSDYEGIKVMPPVREECVKLLSQMLPDIQPEVTILMTLMPAIFVAVEKHQWHSKLNFFLIMKGLVLRADKPIKQRVLEMFGNLLISAIPAVEDEPKVTITEIWMLLLPTYLGSFKTDKVPSKTMALLLDNLSLNLQRADEVEASAIAVFHLVCKVFEMRKDFKCMEKFKYRLDLQIFSAFNFHKLEPVRIAYNALILLALQSGSFSLSEDLALLHTLTVQSLAMESNPQLIELLYKVLEAVIQSITVTDYQAYLQTDLLQEKKLTSWMITAQPDFETFTFVELKTFQSISKDYFKVVFRPANETEWDKFFNQKTQNLTRAIAVMLATGKCSNQIFDALSNKTQVLYRQEGSEETQARTVLNSSMVQMMFTLEQYIRMLVTRKTDIESFEIVDQNYLQDLASQLLQADDRDISINECWSLMPLVETLKQFIDVARPHKYLTELAEYTASCFQEMINSQSFRSRELDLHNLIEQLNHATSQVRQQYLSNLFYQFYGQYQSVLGYIAEASLRLKAASGGVLLGIAKIHLTVADPLNQTAFLQQILNSLIKPLLCQVNQERVLALKQLACDSLLDLLTVLEYLHMWAPLKKAVSLILQMIIESTPDDVTVTRDQALEVLVIKMFNSLDNVYTQFRGQIGASLLKNPKSLDDWLKLASIFLKAQTSQPDKKEYFTMANGLMSKIIQDQCLASPDELPNLPQFVSKLFHQLTESQQSTLIEAMVHSMTLKQKHSFECIDALLDYQINKQESTDLLKYIPVFILPVIKSLSLQLFDDRKIMKILAKLIQILPLNLATLGQTQSKLSEQLQLQVQQGVDFLKVFADNQIVQEYDIQIPIAAKLRTYQLEGINWMAKLGSYNLNCVLCDDMGLGKTIQSLTVVLNESAKQPKHVTNLVVCPTSLTYNWLSEIKKFFTGIKAVVIESSDKNQVFENAQQYDILIINYEKVKGCLAQLQAIDLFYIVLDEAHKIKNSKSVITQSVKQLNCQRKLALSGTPLQNRVSELWSLFDFIMPDFLEDEQTFNKMYNKYLTGNIKKMQEKLEETQQFITALKSLKRRIAPFILRRTKEDVLKELPPKVIQDFECIMPKMQYDVHQVVERTSPFASVIGKQTNSLQNLILHRKACNHPILVQDLVEGLPLVQSGYQHSAKLLGLIEILQDCEIIDPQPNEEQHLFSDQKQPHRALIFCQMQSFLNIVQNDVLNHFNIKHLTLSGSMPAKDRLEVVDQFNNNPQYKCLLLTTAVGGLGLTLTGADVVIFVEHDWNPMKDLQAMDRAHRIGQTRIVNVYRLIVKDTIEEKIMSLQRFKENLAKSLVQARGEQLVNENKQEMDLNDLLKSFEEHSIYQKQTAVPSATSGKKQLTMAQVIAGEQDKEIGQLQKISEGQNFEIL